MPRPRPPHLQREITRHGKAVWYVRVGHGPRVRIGPITGRQSLMPNIVPLLLALLPEMPRRRELARMADRALSRDEPSGPHFPLRHGVGAITFSCTSSKLLGMNHTRVSPKPRSVREKKGGL